MKILSIEERTVSLESGASNAAISFQTMTASAVALTVVLLGRKVTGLGFSSYGRYGHGGLLKERFIPRLEAAIPDQFLDDAGNVSVERFWKVLMTDEKEGGHGERSGAVGVLEMALWDALAKAENLPLWVLLERTFGHPNDGGPAAGSSAVYASGGHYGTGDLAREIGGAMQAGYGWFKMKVGGADAATDEIRVNQALEALDRSPKKRAIDMNGVITGGGGLQRLQVLDSLGLRWIEEPVTPLDYAGLAAVAGAISTPIATGENIFSRSDVANLLRYGGLRTRKDVLQMDMALAYGLTEYMRMIDLAEEAGWSRRDFMPHAGHQMALHTVAGLGLGAHEVAATGDGPFYGIDRTSEIHNGTVRVGDAHGLGLEAKPSLYRYFDGLV